MNDDALPIGGEVPSDMRVLLAQLGQLWAAHGGRPRVSADVLRAWDGLMTDWIKSDLPLVIRKGGGIRGSEVEHESGRKVVVADNSPAQWAFSQAMRGQSFDVSGVRRLLDSDEIPFTFATKTEEKARMRYKRTLRAADNVNKRGWKLCHVDPVGLSTKAPLSSIRIETLAEHSRRLLSPSNQFVVPLAWGGLGEVPEFIAEMRKTWDVVSG